MLTSFTAFFRKPSIRSRRTLWIMLVVLVASAAILVQKRLSWIVMGNSEERTSRQSWRMPNLPPPNLTGVEPKGKLELDDAMAELKRVALLVDDELSRPKDKVELAVRLRDHVHQRVCMGTPPKWYPYDPYRRYHECIIARREPVLCDGMAILFCDLCKAFGLRARKVELHAESAASQGRAPLDMHASAEVLLGDDFVAMDPTFNCCFRADGRLLGYDDLKTGISYEIDENGCQPRLRIQEYYLTLPQLLHRVKTDEHGAIPADADP